MLRFLSKLLSKTAADVPPRSLEPERPDRQSDNRTGRREPPPELDWSCVDYIPLPPSPPTWEVDGREEFHRETTIRNCDRYSRPDSRASTPKS